MLDLFSTDSYSSSFEEAKTRKVDGNKTYGDLLQEANNINDLDEKSNAKDKIFGEMYQNEWTSIKLFVDLLQGKKPAGMKVPSINEAMKDLLSAGDFPFIWSPAIEIVMKEYIMPQNLVSDQIFQTIPYTGQKDQINLKTIGPVQIEEIGRGEPYPEIGSSIMDKAYRIALDIKKYGVKIGIEDDLYQSDNWGVLGFLASQVADGFILHREKLAMQTLNKMGVTIFNNANPSAGLEQSITSGRGIDGSLNGTLSLNDLMTMWTYGNTRGFNFDILLMHPWAWQLFATNPELREIVLQGATVTSALNSTGRQGHMGNTMNGPFGEQWGYWMRGVGGQKQTGGVNYYSPAGNVDPYFAKIGVSPASNTLTPWGNTFNIPPKYWPGGLKVIVTPYVPYVTDTTSKKGITNLYFVDSQKTGVILQGEGPVMEEWRDVEREARYMKFRSRFGIAPVYGGRGVAVARNLVIDKSYVFENVNQRSLTPLTSSSTVSGVSFP